MAVSPVDLVFVFEALRVYHSTTLSPQPQSLAKNNTKLNMDVQDNQLNQEEVHCNQ